MENYILKKCGWNDNQLNFLGTMVYNITTKENEPIADIVSYRDVNQISVQWFVPNKEGDKVELVYSTKENKIVEEKTDVGIKDEKSLNDFLEVISNAINGTKGSFFPKSKIILNNNNNLRI